MSDAPAPPAAPEPSAAPSAPTDGPALAPPSRAKLVLLALPTFLASILIAAHFLRYALFPMFSVGLAVPFLFLVRRTWSVRVLQVWFVIGAVMWAGTLNQIMGDRMLRGEPYLRLAAILGGVILFTLLAAVSLEAKTLRRHWRSGWDF